MMVNQHRQAAKFSSPRPPTAILPRLLLRRIAPLRLRLSVELPTRHMVDAPLARRGREVALNGVRRGAGPGVLGRQATLLARTPWGSGLRSLFLGSAPRPPREAVLVIRTSRAVLKVSADV